VSRVEFPGSIDAAAAVGKPNVRQNQIRAMIDRLLDRSGCGVGCPTDGVAEIRD